MNNLTAKELLFLKAKAFVDAAEELDLEWNRYLLWERDLDPDFLVTNYPAGAPSFDEFVADLKQWLQTAEAEMKGQEHELL